MDHPTALAEWTFSGLGPLIFMLVIAKIVGGLAYFLSK
jgi:hypothetical protein